MRLQVVTLLAVCSVGCHREEPVPPPQSTQSQARGGEAQEATAGSEFALTPQQLADARSKGERGDATSIQKLILHYELADPDHDQAVHWQRVAAQAGDAGAMVNLAVYLAMEGTKDSCREAESWLKQASASKASDRLVARADSKLAQIREHGCAPWLRPAEE